MKNFKRRPRIGSSKYEGCLSIPTGIDASICKCSDGINKK